MHWLSSLSPMSFFNELFQMPPPPNKLLSNCACCCEKSGAGELLVEEGPQQQCRPGCPSASDTLFPQGKGARLAPEDTGAQLDGLPGRFSTPAKADERGLVTQRGLLLRH